MNLAAVLLFSHNNLFCTLGLILKKQFVRISFSENAGKQLVAFIVNHYYAKIQT